VAALQPNLATEEAEEKERSSIGRFRYVNGHVATRLQRLRYIGGNISRHIQTPAS
jgi:hypothetical protein